MEFIHGYTPKTKCRKKKSGNLVKCQGRFLHVKIIKKKEKEKKRKGKE
jgi:hypothetical protein